MASLTFPCLICLMVVSGILLGSCNQHSAREARTEPTSATSNGINGSCPVTKPPATPFVPHESPWRRVEANSPGPFYFYGNDRLWVELPRDGTWRKLVLNYAPVPPVYSTGMTWGRQGYNRYTERHPKLMITGRRLDAAAPPLVARQAEGCCSVFDGEQPRESFISVGVDFPTLGCWEITGRYQGEDLRFVMMVTKE